MAEEDCNLEKIITSWLRKIVTLKNNNLVAEEDCNLEK
jgi:hypothetical protein